MPAPKPTRLFHITAIANLPAILASGALLSKNGGAAAGINYQNIAHSGAQGARAIRAVPEPLGGVVHDYVPFYFAPRSPMCQVPWPRAGTRVPSGNVTLSMSPPPALALFSAA